MLRLHPKEVPFLIALLSVCLWQLAFDNTKAKGIDTTQDTAEAAIKHYNAGKEFLKQGAYMEAIKEAEAALKLQPDKASFYLLRGQALFGLFEREANDESNVTQSVIPYNKLKEAIKDFAKYLELDPNATDAGVWRDQVRLLSLYAGVPNLDNAKRDIFLPSEVTTKARILRRPQPNFTFEAENADNGIRGTVRLLAILGADSTVNNIIVLKPLPYGLTEKAIEASRKITFVPANKDGRAVSQATVVEYYFDIPPKKSPSSKKPIFPSKPVFTRNP